MRRLRFLGQTDPVYAPQKIAFLRRFRAFQDAECLFFIFYAAFDFLQNSHILYYDYRIKKIKDIGFDV